MPSSPALSKSATIIKLASKELPPWLIKGKVTPVSGKSLVTPPTMIKACITSEAVSPVAANAAISDFARAAVARPRIASTTYASKTAELPNKPISSPIAEKIKSEATTGISVARPRPIPLPTKPPSASE